MSVIKTCETISIRTVWQFLLRWDRHLNKHPGIKSNKTQYDNWINEPECTCDLIISFIDRSEECSIPCSNEIGNYYKNTVEDRIDRFCIYLKRHILCIEDDRYHGHTVQVETELCAQTDRRDTHIQRKPAIDKSYIQIKISLLNKEEPCYLNSRCRNTEPDKERSVTVPEKAHKTKHQNKDHGVDQKGQFSYFL